MSDTQQPKRFQCRHIHADGRRCGSPALRNEELCYYHHTSRKPAPHGRARRGRQTTFDLHLPDGNDRTGLQLAIVDVLRRIATNEVDPRRAGLLLYGLQIAATNLPQTRLKPVSAQPAETVEGVVDDENLGALAPRYELIAEDPGARNRSLTEQLLAELRRGREDGEQAAVCPSCKAHRQDTDPTSDGPSAPVESVPSATPEILPSLEASAGDNPGCPIHDGSIVLPSTAPRRSQLLAEQSGFERGEAFADIYGEVELLGEVLHGSSLVLVSQVDLLAE